MAQHEFRHAATTIANDSTVAAVNEESLDDRFVEIHHSKTTRSEVLAELPQSETLLPNR
jgi:hypothetical protein